MHDLFEIQGVSEATGGSGRLKSLANRTGMFNSMVTRSRALFIAVSILTFDCLSCNALKEPERGELCPMVLQFRLDGYDIMNAGMDKTTYRNDTAAPASKKSNNLKYLM
jgi:hypothetical protein